MDGTPLCLSMGLNFTILWPLSRKVRRQQELRNWFDSQRSEAGPFSSSAHGRSWRLNTGDKNRKAVSPNNSYLHNSVNLYLCTQLFIFDSLLLWWDPVIILHRQLDYLRRLVKFQCTFTLCLLISFNSVYFPDKNDYPVVYQGI